MDFFTLFLINAVLFVGSALLRPKPDIEDAQATPFEDAGFPSTDPQRKIPVAFGRVRVNAPQVIDVFDYTPVPIRETIDTGPFSSDKTTVGFQYFASVQMALCLGPVRLRRILYDDEVIWTGDEGPVDAGTAIDINLPEFLGGLKQGGGLVGRIRFFGGSETQTPAAALAGRQTELIAYRGVAYVLFEGFNFGESPNVQPFQFEVESVHNGLGLGNPLIGAELNPMAMVYAIFTNSDWGYGIPAADVDTAALTTAASTLAGESNGISLLLTRETPLEKVMRTVNTQVDGVHRYDPSAGLWTYVLARDDYTVSALPLLDPDSVLELRRFKRPSWDELSNIVELQYSTREHLDSPTPAIVQDRGLYARVGDVPKPVTKNYPGVYSEALAARLAARILRKAAFPFAQVELVVNRNAWQFMPGSVFRFSWPQRGIDQLVLRVTKISFGTPDNPQIQISAVEDVFGQSAALFSSTGGGSSFTPANLPPASIAVAFLRDEPYFLQALDPAVTTAGATEKALLAARRPQGNALQVDAYSRTGSDAFELRAEGRAYAATGTLQSGIAESDGPDTLGTVVVESVDFAQKLVDFTTASAGDIRTAGSGLLLVQHPSAEWEFMAYESLVVSGSEVTCSTVHRGLIDTLNQAHAAGARVWFIGAEGAITTPQTWGDTDAIDARLVNVASTGRSALASATTLLFTFRNRAGRPYPVGRFRINGSRYPSSAVALGGDVLIEWAARDRTTGAIRFQDDATDEPETGVELELRIYDDGGNTLLRTVVASGSTRTGDDTFTTATSYDYTNALQVTDGGPFAALRLEMTSWNSTGAVRSLLDVVRIVDVTI